ncbi:MAG: hypothetical protein JKY42_08515 [Flavobacteriales bacterium]|nr:hypothetical protein [Flavobacteriales bacterium]
MNYLKEVELEKAYLYLVDKDYTLLRFKDKIDFEEEDATEINDITFEWVKGKPFVVLVDARNIRSNISHKARERFNNDKRISGIRKGQAIVVNNLHTRMLANFYMKFHKPANPIKVFSNYQKAVEWLRINKDEFVASN